MTIRGHPDALGTTTLEADVVVVGSGPGGAAIARVLAEGGKRVIVVEEGPPQSRFKPSQLHTMRYHMQEGGSMVAMGTAPIAVAAGRGVGGGSLVNSAICWRTPDDVLSSWTDVVGADTYHPDRMRPVYDEVGAIIEVVDTPEEIAGENNLIVVRGARALGLEGGLLRRNTPRCVGCGMCNNGCPSGGKASVDKNLLALARAAGAIVQADVKVDRVLIEGDRAVGVEGTVLDTDTFAPVGRLTVRARQVVLSAGAVGTPRLLFHSGLAERLGPRVGKGLHLHPGNGIFGLFDHEVRMWTGATQAAWFADPALPGVLPHTMSVPPGVLLMALGKTGQNLREGLELIPRMSGCLVMISDKGEGTVSASSSGHASMTYEFTDGDVENMRQGLKRTCEVLRAGGAGRLLVPIAGVGWVDTLDQAFAAIDKAGLTDYQAMYAAHPMATCRMGRNADVSVIAPTGEAHNLPGLFIADSSIFPTSLGVNPQWTTMVMATIIGRQMLSV